MSRLPRTALSDYSDEQREMFDEIVKSRPVQPEDGHIGGPFDVWLQNAEMSKRLVGLGGFFRFRTSVDRRYIELAILVTGAHWQAQFEWYAHEPMAREAGVPEFAIELLKIGERPNFTDAGDIATYNLATELHLTRKLTEPTYAAAVAEFGAQGVAELVGLCGYYSLVSMSLNAFDVDLPDGAEKPFAE